MITGPPCQTEGALEQRQRFRRSRQHHRYADDVGERHKEVHQRIAASLGCVDCKRYFVDNDNARVVVLGNCRHLVDQLVEACVAPDFLRVRVNAGKSSPSYRFFVWVQTFLYRYGLFCMPSSPAPPQSGTTAVTSISTLARSSTSADTSTAVMAMLKLPISSRKISPISR